MKEYRERLKIGAPESSKPKKTSTGWLNLGLASEFGAHEDLTWGASNSGESLSVDQEFRAYITGHLAKSDVDILKFWEVSILLFLRCAGFKLFFFDRYMERHTLPSTRSRWTSWPSKHRRSLAKECFLLAPKPTG